MPDFCELRERHPQGSAKDTTSCEKTQAAYRAAWQKSAGGEKHETAAERPDSPFKEMWLLLCLSVLASEFASTVYMS